MFFSCFDLFHSCVFDFFFFICSCICRCVFFLNPFFVFFFLKVIFHFTSQFFQAMEHRLCTIGVERCVFHLIPFLDWEMGPIFGLLPVGAEPLLLGCKGLGVLSIDGVNDLMILTLDDARPRVQCLMLVTGSVLGFDWETILGAHNCQHCHGRLSCLGVTQMSLVWEYCNGNAVFHHSDFRFPTRLLPLNDVCPNGWIHVKHLICYRNGTSYEVDCNNHDMSVLIRVFKLLPVMTTRFISCICVLFFKGPQTEELWKPNIPGSQQLKHTSASPHLRHPHSEWLAWIFQPGALR